MTSPSQIASQFVTVTTVEVFVGFLVAQAPLDPSWGAFLRDGGAVAAILFQTAAFVWVLKYILEQHAKQNSERDQLFSNIIDSRDKAWRKTIERMEKKLVDSARDQNIALMECTAMMSRMLPLTEAAIELEGIQFKPDQSLILQRRRIGESIKSLKSDKEQSLKQEQIDSALEEEDSNT